MNLFKFNYCVESCAFTTSNDEGSRILRNELCNGNHVESYADKISLELLEGSEKELKLRDFVYLYDDGLLSTHKTFEILEKYLSECGEWTRMFFKDTPYYFFSTLKTLDCLDEEKTIYDIYKGSIEELKGAKYGIKKHVFKDLDYTGYPIFRIKQKPFPIVTQGFIDILSEHELTGLKFEKLN
ncbi:MAG: hypothetical protein COA86_09265 [Kangiella sp.]|nr:MAG: hypothetical protein COA86_09265 [Kangiella sp.]